MENKKAIAYVDGHNLYHGIIARKNIPAKGYTYFSEERPWGDLLWLNIESYINSYKIKNSELTQIKFFQAPSYKPESLKRQQIYQNALMTLKTVNENSFYFGKFSQGKEMCQNCGSEHIHYTEKRTDAAMSTEILSDFFLNNCEITIIIGGDTDQIPVIEKIKEINPLHEIYVIFPPSRKSKDIYNILGKEYCMKTDYKRLLGNQLSDVVYLDGFKIEKPEEHKKINNA